MTLATRPGRGAIYRPISQEQGIRRYEFADFMAAVNIHDIRPLRDPGDLMHLSPTLLRAKRKIGGLLDHETAFGYFEYPHRSVLYIIPSARARDTSAYCLTLKKGWLTDVTVDTPNGVLPFERAQTNSFISSLQERIPDVGDPNLTRFIGRFGTSRR